MAGPIRIFPPELLTGGFVEHYLPAASELQPLGRAGGFKVTFKGRWKGHEAAIQVHYRFDDERLDRESAALKAIDCPHVVKLLEETEFSVEEHALPVYVCEFIKGRTLDELVEGGSRWDRRQLVQLATHLARGLEAIHGQRLIHRDIKPQNIMLTDGGRAVILDLGIAKHLERTTITILHPGTPGWKSPEQLRSEELDQRSDLFALGLVLHYAATGEHAFGEGQLDNNILTRSPRRLAEGAYGDLSQKVAALLSRPRHQRPRNAARLLEMLTVPAVA